MRRQNSICGARRGKQGSWTDVYGAAATLYFLLTAHRPPEAPERMQSPDPLQPARQFVPGLPPEFDQVLSRALAVRPEQRLQAIADFKK